MDQYPEPPLWFDFVLASVSAWLTGVVVYAIDQNLEYAVITGLAGFVMYFLWLVIFG